MERRGSPRVRCHMRCELARAGRRTQGTVLDLSEGGLCVQSELDVEQGTAVAILLRLPRGREIAVEALVWHVRRVRGRVGGAGSRVLGLMIAKAPDEYYGLLHLTEPDPPSPPQDQQVVDPPLPSQEEPAPSLTPFRIRVKARSGPRTRVLSMSAQSVDEAKEFANSDLGSDWEILEVYEG